MYSMKDFVIGTVICIYIREEKLKTEKISFKDSPQRILPMRASYILNHNAYTNISQKIVKKLC